MNDERSGRVMGWVKKLGVAGFLFFLVKGLLWLIVPAVVIAARKAMAGG